MNRNTTPTTAILVLTLALALTACQTPMREKGNIISPEAVNRIQTGQTTRDEVRTMLGSPTMINSFRQERWVYIQDRRLKGDRAINRLEITFDKEGIVRDLQRNFGDQLLDPTLDQSSDIPPMPHGYWWTDMWEGKSASPATKPTATEVEPSFLEKYFINKPRTPPPDVSFRPEEEGWWKGMWSADPTKGSPAVGLPDDPSRREPPPTGSPANNDGGTKSWWKFW